MQRCLAAYVPCYDVRTGIEQKAGDCRVIVIGRRSLMERSIAVLVLRVEVGARVDEGANDRQVGLRPRRNVQRCGALPVTRGGRRRPPSAR